MEKSLGKWSRKEFDALPVRKWSEDIGEFDSLVILPMRRMHESGFRCMDFVAVIKETPLCRLSGCSDVIHIDGIGGYGYKWIEKGEGVPNSKKIMDWSIDCLPKSGLLRLFSRRKLRASEALSSFEIFAIEK
jgi:hypothetical protein